MPGNRGSLERAIYCAPFAQRQMETLLQVRDLAIRYCSGDAVTHQAVGGVSFDIAPGETVGLMGESGCGKTSIALALLSLLPKEGAEVSGSILFRGHELLSTDENSLRKIRGAGISLVFQEPSIALNPVMRVGEQIAEVIHAHRDWSWKRCRAETESALARVGLPPSKRILSAYPHQLSGGQCQRVVLAQALSCDPALVIADEPTAALDARSQSELVILLRNLKQELKLSLLLISHAPEIQANLADRLLIMAGGQIVEQGSFAQVYWHPSHHCTRTILRRKSRADFSEYSESGALVHEELVR